MKSTYTEHQQKDLFYQKTEYENPDFPVRVHYQDLGKLYLNEVRWQWHEEVEMLIINNGVAEIATDDSTLFLTAGQAAIINRQVLHTIRSKGTDNCSYYSTSFDTRFVLWEAERSLREKYMDAFQSKTFKVLILDESIEWQNQIIDCIGEVITANLTRRFGYELLSKAALCRLWALLCAQLVLTEETQELKPSSVDEQRIKQAINYIRTNYNLPITLENIASSIHISKSECCRLFKRALQMTPFEYLMKYRIYEAAKRISDTDHKNTSMAALALAAGFNNISYFNKLFKKYMGCTPTQYKKNMSVSSIQNHNQNQNQKKTDMHVFSELI